MKTLKAICTATLLALVLSVSAFAGDIGTPGAPKSSVNVSITCQDPNYDQEPCDPTIEPPETGTLGLENILDALLFMIY